MRTAEEYVDSWHKPEYYIKEKNGYYYRHTDVEQMLIEYAEEVLRDYDNWKAHKTPELVELYIKEKGL